MSTKKYNKIQERINSLLKDGANHTFQNNSERSNIGIYGRASEEFIGWATSVGEFIREHYGKDSEPYKMYQKFSLDNINGWEESNFIKQKSFVSGALNSCKGVVPVKAQSEPLIGLLKNRLFWIIVIGATGGAFTLGNYFGHTKFDKEKLELYETNTTLNEEKDSLKNVVAEKDSIITELEKTRD